MMDTHKGIVPFVLRRPLAVFLVFEFAAIALWLPSVMLGAPAAG